MKINNTIMIEEILSVCYETDTQILKMQSWDNSYYIATDIPESVVNSIYENKKVDLTKYKVDVVS